jgi:hypothetical protein
MERQEGVADGWTSWEFFFQQILDGHLANLLDLAEQDGHSYISVASKLLHTDGECRRDVHANGAADQPGRSVHHVAHCTAV